MAAMELWFLAEQLFFFSLLPSPLFLEMAEIITPSPSPHTHSSFSPTPPPSRTPFSCCVLTKKVRDCSVFPRQTQAVWTSSRKTDGAIFTVWLHPPNAHRDTRTRCCNMVMGMTQRRPRLAVVCFTLTMLCWPGASQQWSTSEDAPFTDNSLLPWRGHRVWQMREISLDHSESRLFIHTLLLLLLVGPLSILNQDCFQRRASLKVHTKVFIHYTVCPHIKRDLNRADQSIFT